MPIEYQLSRDELLTAMTLYWVTESFNSATRFYYETAHHPWTPSHPGSRVLNVPTGVTIMPRDVVQMPRGWAEQYYDLRSWNVLPEVKPEGHASPGWATRSRLPGSRAPGDGESTSASAGAAVEVGQPVRGGGHVSTLTACPVFAPGQLFWVSDSS